MTPSARVSLTACALSAGVLIIACAFAVWRPAGIDASDVSSGTSSFEFQQNPGGRLPLAATFVDEAGRSVALADYFTKSPVMLVLEYLRCASLCGVTLRNVVEALHGLPLESGRDYQLVAISIDPRDKPSDAMAARAKYAGLLDRARGEAGMHFLTATSPAAVREVAATVGFPYHYDMALDAYIHPAGFVVATPDGVISRYIEGVAISPQQLIGAFADAEQNKSPGPLTRLLLFCRPHGVPLGRFTVPVLTAFTIANIAAALTVFAIFAAIRRRRHS